MTKQELRKIYLQKRRDLSQEACQEGSRQIATRFFQDVNLSSIKTIHIFLAILKNNEPDTWPIIQKIKSDYPSVQISLPRINEPSNSLENFYFENPEQLKTNALGIPEPTTGIPTNTTDIDMVLIPLLCFDRKGNRIGYGKGFYDKLLSACRTDCKKIGITFFEPVDVIDDINALDVPLDSCVTPERTYFF